MVALIVLAGATQAGGCARPEVPRPPLVKVRGSVSFRGQPTPGAVVTLYCDGPAQPGELRPRGVVAADGSFVLSTFVSGDGAPPGRYRVAISWKDAARFTGKEEDRDQAEELLPGRYQAAERSGLVVEIVAGMDQLPRFELR